MSSSNQQPPDTGSARKRRRGQRRVPDSTVPSPCIAVCQYNADQLCAGCYRTPDEIREWIVMTREEKLAVLEKLDARRQNYS